MSSISTISDLKKCSHGYVNSKPWLFLKTFFFFFDAVVSFINLSYIRTIWDRTVFVVIYSVPKLSFSATYKRKSILALFPFK